MSDSPTLSFACLQYDVSDIDTLITKLADIQNFVFCYYFSPASTAIGLVVWAHSGGADPVYIEDYDIPTVYGSDVLAVPGPVQLCNNSLSIGDMQNLINPKNGLRPDYLVFIPKIDNEGYIYYNINGHSNDSGDGRGHGVHDGDGFNTNPSPPAT